MKRKIRLNYSTEYFPSEHPHKRQQASDTADNHERTQESQLEQNSEASILVEDQKDIPLRECTHSSTDQKTTQQIQIEQQQPTSIETVIAERLRTNPIQLIKKSKANQYGNFHSYYDHRCEAKWNDPRIRVLSRDWFLNKEVLDIGCNDGSFTMQIAIKYFPLKIQGVDIDHSLINSAIDNLLLLEKQQAKVKQQSRLSEQQPKAAEQIQDISSEDVDKRVRDKLSRIPKQFLIDGKNENENSKEQQFLEENAHKILQSELDHIEEIHPELESGQRQEIQSSSTHDNAKQTPEDNNSKEQSDLQQEQCNDKANLVSSLDETTNKEEPKYTNQLEKPASETVVSKIEIKRRFPDNVFFRLENYVEKMDSKEKYDTICCFSTTKWIHLNFGDQGIKRLFDKVYQSLSNNGIFILEAQEWRSYKKKLSYSNEFKEVIKSIQLHPGQFKEHLLKTYNYVLEKEITPQVNTDKIRAFFKRPVLVFRKLENEQKQ